MKSLIIQTKLAKTQASLIIKGINNEPYQYFKGNLRNKTYLISSKEEENINNKVIKYKLNLKLKII